MNLLTRSRFSSTFSASLLLGCLAVASASQLGCQQAHEPPKLDDAAMQQKYDEQMKLREMERGGKS